MMLSMMVGTNNHKRGQEIENVKGTQATHYTAYRRYYPHTVSRVYNASNEILAPCTFLCTQSSPTCTDEGKWTRLHLPSCVCCIVRGRQTSSDAADRPKVLGVVQIARLQQRWECDIVGPRHDSGARLVNPCHVSCAFKSAYSYPPRLLVVKSAHKKVDRRHRAAVRYYLCEVRKVALT